MVTQSIKECRFVMKHICYILLILIYTSPLFAGTAVVKSKGATVHSAPQGGSSVIATLNINTVVEISDTTYQGWHSITVSGKNGYIHSSNVILSDDRKPEDEEKENPFDIREKSKAQYYFDLAVSPVARAGGQIHSAITLKLGYEDETFERGISYYYGMGLGKYKLKVSSLLVDFGWKFTKYTSVGVIGGYEFLKFSNLEVQKSAESGRAYRAPLDPRGWVFGAFLNQKIFGESTNFIITEGAMVETYNIEKYSGSDIYYDDPIVETKNSVKKGLFLFVSFGVRFSI
jgi:hypothetical protein